MAGVSVKFGADTSELDAAIRRSKTRLNELGKELRDGITNVAKWGAATAAAAAGGVTALAIKGLEAVDSQAKLARNLGGSITAVQALDRAAARAGVQTGELTSASQRLSQKLGEAATKGGEAKNTLDRLGLSARDLSAMDIDERMATLADAFRQQGMNAQETAFHLRNLGIRQASIVNLMQAGGDEIRNSRDAIRDLGLEIDAIDAAKVEMANDAFGDVRLALSAISQRLAIEVAPLLRAISEMFTDAAKEAGGFGEMTSGVFDWMVKAIGFVMDAMEGLRRVFQLVGQANAVLWLSIRQGALEAASAIINFPTKAANNLIGTLNRIPWIELEPVGMSGLGERINQEIIVARRAVSEGVQDMHDTLMREMPSRQFERFVANARESAEQAAKEMADLSHMLMGESAPAGMSDEEIKAAEAHKKQIADRLERVREANMSEIELVNKRFEQENEVVREAWELRLLTEQEYEALLRDQKNRHEEELTEIERKAAEERRRINEEELRSRQAMTGQILGNITTLMNTESRKMFEIGKAAGIANSIISTYTGMSKALELGWPLGPIAAAAIGAKGFAQVAAIRSQQFRGGGGASGSATAAVNDATTPISPSGGGTGQQTIINLSGDTFGRQQVIDLIESLNEASADGSRIRVA